ncbi:MAG: hypothetical protein A2822_00345 [Candidatus Staskawiczbacteria bacterium RIFCSPHIGHO2_01_FULL_41_41]|uniref:Uncharacterized protein n=1 Tax=Candidatus Staskawiczbacteria bacterium RIFCSPHIGHO2_01_FULL_41_41 TaxID=1802203 RepID=A0A1G2HRS5_9BACT|nr:MAG: hypothetical protein A2822_00345 [Candidatus Staskawiczbacteria bacterium RIFCSPHIGHO2_01_FULL_41_41]OGZ74842.1 MAG: hypothetical protein A3A12_03250 [Candidatus Staskawiczbacteria bacterium RIFCSPLOWO2_01_FULL_43_17b]
MESENLIEFQNVASYVLELLRIFNPNLEKRPEKKLLIGHFVIQSIRQQKGAPRRAFLLPYYKDACCFIRLPRLLRQRLLILALCLVEFLFMVITF